MKTLLAAVPVIILAAASWTTFSRIRADLSRQRDEIAAEWSQVNEALEQRAAVARNLADTAKAFQPAPGEIDELAAARAALVESQAPQDRIRANDRLSAALSRLLLASDRHPKLAADPEFRKLQDELKRSEDRIAVSRLRYNDALVHYNSRLQTFPHNLVARLSGFTRNDAYFQTIQF